MDFEHTPQFWKHSSNELETPDRFPVKYGFNIIGRMPIIGQNFKAIYLRRKRVQGSEGIQSVIKVI